MARDRKEALLDEIHDSLHVINASMNLVVDMTLEGGDFEGMAPQELKDGQGRFLMADFVATKAQLILAETMLRKEQ